MSHLIDPGLCPRDAEQAFCLDSLRVQVADGFGDYSGHLWLSRAEGHSALELWGRIGGAYVESIQKHGGGVDLTVHEGGL